MLLCLVLGYALIAGTHNGFGVLRAVSADGVGPLPLLLASYLLGLALPYKAKLYRERRRRRP